MIVQHAVQSRDSGIEAVGAVPWGTHFCVFYDDRQDLLDVLVPYFRAGLSANEACMWVTSEPLVADDARAQLARAVPGVDAHIASGALEVIPHTDWYLAGGCFDAQRVLSGWVERHDRALAGGFEGLRLHGNTFWLERSGWDDFQQYEQLVTEVIGHYRMLALCTYSLERCNALEVIDVVRAHQFAVAKRGGEWVLLENSERKRTAAAIEALNARLEEQTRALEETNRDLERFSYSASHDLRAPLRAISGFAEIVEQDEADHLSPDGRMLLASISRSAQRMNDLIDDLLEFARCGNRPLEVTPLAMRNLVESVVGELRSEDPSRAISVTVGPLDDAGGDGVLLRQVWTNLLRNAFKFTGGRRDAIVEVTSERLGGEVAYHVRDNGVGFDQSHAEHLFGVFQRLHGAEFPGTGIGLAVVARIVARHGGRTWAEAEVGKGATVSFSLPVTPLS